jgi:Holliday junction resolvase
MASLSDGELRTRIAFHIAAGENLEEAQALVRLGGSFSNKRFRDIYHEMKGDRAPKVPAPAPPPPPVDREALAVKLHSILLSHASMNYQDLARMLHVDLADVLLAISALDEKGYNIVSDHLSVELHNTITPAPTKVIDVSKWKTKHHIYGLTGDNHLGSKYSRLDVLNALFDIWEGEGVKTVYQCGNIIDGEARFNVHDLLVKGIGGQTDYLIDNWPQRKGMETHFVTGDDHEGWYVQREGIDIGRHIDQEANHQGRHDLVYLGHMEHTMDLRVGDGRSIMRLIHGGGGTAYAISYKSQKIVECVPLDTEILTLGGWKRCEEVAVGATVMGYDVILDRCLWTTVHEKFAGTGRINRYSNDQFDVRCTPDHRWAIERESRGGGFSSTKTRLLQSIDATVSRSRIIQAAAGPDGVGLPEYSGTFSREGAVEGVLMMTSGERRAFINGMLLGEGTKVDHSGTVIFSQRPGPVNDAFRLACFLEGIATTDRPTPDRPGIPVACRRVTVLKKRMRNVSSLKMTPLGEQSVWCLRTGTGAWVMRQGTTITITGNSYQGGEKPNILCIGHFHKFDHSYPREVTAIQVGCFTGNTSVLTPMGRTPIRKMKTGDEVICADGKARKVVRVFRRMSGQMRVRINYGRKGRPDQSVVATEEHPILIERSGIRCWMAAKNVKAGDLVFTQTTTCRACGTKIPWWGKMCVSCNPVDDPAVREKIAISRGGSKERTRGGSDGDTHMQRDILPLCRELQEMGWKVVPVGAGVIPDAIGFKDGKVVAIESERSRGALLEFKQNKYVGSPIMEFIDEVLWVPVSTRKAQPRTDYAIDPEMGLAKVRVISVTEIVPKRRKREVVYNLDVEEDHTYIAGGIAVHNCTEDQTPFMRKKEIQAMVGGVTLEFDQDDHGIVHNVKVAWHPFFDKGFYSSDAWKYHFKNPNLK